MGWNFTWDPDEATRASEMTPIVPRSWEGDFQFAFSVREDSNVVTSLEEPETMALLEGRHCGFDCGSANNLFVQLEHQCLDLVPG